MNSNNYKYTNEWYNSYPLQNGFDAHLKYFNSGAKENQDYWECFNGRPDFENKTIVDVGCGHGSLCIDIAVSNSSSKVIGVDISEELIDFAKWNLHVNYPELESRVEFYCNDIRELTLPPVDAVLSKASFEHILDLDDVLKCIKSKLKPGGKLYTGFMPLYHSQFGGHPRIHRFLPFPWLPWAHLMASEKFILSRVNAQREQKASSIFELGLNKLSINDFRALFEDSGLKQVFFKINVPGRSWKATMMSALSKIKGLEKYMVYSIFAILEKPVDNKSTNG